MVNGKKNKRQYNLCVFIKILCLGYRDDLCKLMAIFLGEVNRRELSWALLRICNENYMLFKDIVLFLVTLDRSMVSFIASEILAAILIADGNKCTHI